MTTRCRVPSSNLHPSFASFRLSSLVFIFPRLPRIAILGTQWMLSGAALATPERNKGTGGPEETNLRKRSVRTIHFSSWPVPPLAPPQSDQSNRAQEEQRDCTRFGCCATHGHAIQTPVHFVPEMGSRCVGED